MRSKFFTIIIICTVFALRLKGQEYQDDAVVWAGIYLEKKLNNNFAVHLKHQSRFHDNVSRYERASADFGVTYTVNKNIRVLFDYMYLYRRRNDLSFSHRHRLYAALILRKKINQFTVLYRNRVQGQLNDFYSSNDGQVPVFYERNKLTLKYDLNKRIGLYVSEELFLPFYQAQNKGFDRSRTYLGLTCNLTKRNEVDLFFGYQHELNAFRATRRLFIYGVTYSYHF